MVASRGITCEACDRTAQEFNNVSKAPLQTCHQGAPPRVQMMGSILWNLKLPFFINSLHWGLVMKVQPRVRAAFQPVSNSHGASAANSAEWTHSDLGQETRKKRKRPNPNLTFSAFPRCTTNRPHELRATATAKMSFMISHQTSEFAHDVNAAAGAWGPSTSRAKYVIPPSPSLPD